MPSAPSSWDASPDMTGPEAARQGGDEYPGGYEYPGGDEYAGRREYPGG